MGPPRLWASHSWSSAHSCGVTILERSVDQHRELWEDLGDREAYYAVATLDRYRSRKLDEAARQQFFAEGEEQVANAFSSIERLFGECRPASAVDFGCGVGRLTAALARRCDRVLGVDISGSMIAEARKNCAQFELSNVDFKQSQDFYASNDTFDLIYSFIVFQHMPPDQGIAVFRNLLDRLSPGGIGAVHFTFGGGLESNLSVPYRLYRRVPALLKLRGLLASKKEHPFVPIYEYQVDEILAEIQSRGCDNCFVDLTDHGQPGGTFIFQLPEKQHKK